MTIERPAVDVAAVAVTPDDLSPSARRSIFLYLGILIVLVAFGSPAGGLIDIPISFLLKNKLHLQAHEVAGFRLVAAPRRSPHRPVPPPYPRSAWRRSFRPPPPELAVRPCADECGWRVDPG